MRTDVVKVSLALRHGWNRLIEILRRALSTELLRKEEEGLVPGHVVVVWDEEWPAQGVAEVVPPIERGAGGLVKEVPGVKLLIANELVRVTVKRRRPRLRGG